MQIITHFERAIYFCEQGAREKAITSWDSGAVMWSGSKTGDSGESYGSGKLLYTLSYKRCQNFATCFNRITGEYNNVDYTSAKANDDLLKLFESGQVRPEPAKTVHHPSLLEQMYRPRVPCSVQSLFSQDVHPALVALSCRLR